MKILMLCWKKCVGRCHYGSIKYIFNGGSSSITKIEIMIQIFTEEKKIEISCLFSECNE